MDRNTRLMKGDTETFLNEKKDDQFKPRNGHRYNLYGLNYNEVINNALGGKGGKETIS
jgi:hypothetical protein